MTMFAAETATIPATRWSRIGSLLFLTYLVAYIDRTNMSIAAPAMRETLGITQGQIGVLMSAFFWGYVASLAVSGFVVARFGPKRTIVTALVVFGLASMATGIVTDLAHLTVARVVLGLGEGMVFPAFTVLFVQWFPDWERARISMISLLTIPISAMIMAPLGGWLISAHSYGVMFVVQATPPLLAAALFLRFAADRPEDDGRLSTRERDFIVTNRAHGAAENGTLRDVLLNPRVWAFAVIYLFWAIGLYGFGQWLPSLLKQLSNQGILAIGWLTVIPYGCAAAAMYFVARAADRNPAQRTLLVAVPMLVAGAALLASRLGSGNLIMGMVILSIACVGVHAAFGPWWAWVLSFVPRDVAGLTSGIVLAIGNFGGIIGPIVVGALARGESVSTGYYVLGYCLLGAGGLAVLVGATVRRPDPDSKASTHPVRTGTPTESHDGPAPTPHSKVTRS
jgi:sugar phosphate permease